MENEIRIIREEMKDSQKESIDPLRKMVMAHLIKGSLRPVDAIGE